MKARIETPPGYYRVYSGKVRAGDRKFFPETLGRSCWSLVQEGDCSVGADVEGFYAVIRPLPTPPKKVKCYHASMTSTRDGYWVCDCGAKFHWTDPEMQKE